MSGPNKFSRGGGRGLNRMAPPPLGRGMVPLRRGQPPGKEKGRPDDSSKGRGLVMKGNSTGASGAGGVQGEDFQLVSCQEQGTLPLYAMAIRLTPGMLETLKRVEELGETTTMKFGVNNSGHIIKVGEEEFRFSSAPESGDLCDIFEEQRRGEDGNGLLVEAGSVWRKLSVIRTLNATDKATVKARSVEAERQQKSRKAIILDHSNSLMNNKAATAGDANGRRGPVMAKPKKEPPQKKRKIVAVAPVVPPLSAVKTRPLPPMIEKAPVASAGAAATAKPGKTTSVSSPPDGPPISSRPPPSQGALAPPPFKPRGATAEEIGGAAKIVSATHKDKLSSPALATTGETAAVVKTAGVVNMSELRNCLITLLVDNPKGMTIKAVEKALGEAMPNVRPDKKQIDKVIKAIASFHAPGKYMLKEGVEKGAFAKPSPGSGSSPETAPVDSPPLGDLPALMENTPQEISGTVGNLEDLKRTDGTTRNSSLPLRGGESAMNRAIRRAGEIFRGNAEKLHFSELDKSRTAVESSGHRLEDSSGKDSTAGPEIVDADHVSIGGDESPVVGSPENENDGKFNGMEVETIDPDLQNLGSPHLFEADNKKENSDGSDSSSSSSSSSESGSDSDSESASGSRSGSGSETDSDGSSSSASDDENMDEDVDIISDDDEKAGVDIVVAEAPKQKLKSKESRTSLERQESRVPKQASRGKKQKQKGSDAGMTPHESEDAEIGDGGEAGYINKFVDQEAAEKGAKGSNSEEEVDVVSSDEDISSPQRIVSPAECGEHNDKAIVPDLELNSNFPSMEEAKGGHGSLHAAVPARSGSESDHSIEEYETRAETSGVRGSRVKVLGEQKDEILERKIEGIDSVVSLRSNGSGGTKGLETPQSVDRGSKTEVAGISPTVKGSDKDDSPMVSKEHFESSGVSLRADHQQRPFLGTPPVPRDGLDQDGSSTHREPPVKAKATESKRKGLNKNFETGEIQEKALTSQRGPQRFRKMMEPPGRTAKFSEVSLKLPGEGEVHSKAVGGFYKPSEEPDLIVKGPESRETTTADRPVKSSRDDNTLERHDVNRKRNREAGLLAKPAKTSELNRDNINLVGKPGRDSKQAKKLVEKVDGLKRGEPSERAVTGSEFGEKLTKDAEIQRRLLRDGESWRKSPKGIESGSRISSDNEVHIARLKDFQKSDTDQSEAAKIKVLRMTSDLELGELRDIVAGEELRTKDSLRLDGAKIREGSELLSKQPQTKMNVSPDNDKPRNAGKLGDVKKLSPADLKKQQLAKKELQKADIQAPSRETLRVAVNGQKFGAGHDEKLEMGYQRAGEAPRTFGDHNEKLVDWRNGKRLADDSGNHELGRPLKRSMFEQSHGATSVGQGAADATSYKGNSVLDTAAKTSALDGGKSSLADVGNPLAANSNKLTSDNGQLLGPKGKAQEVNDKEVDKRGFGFDGKQKTTAALLGPGSKKDTQSNGKKRANQPRDKQNREFFAPFEKRTAELRGPILHYDQYLEYCKEYNEKYPVYVRLHTVLESDKEDFENFSRDITLAKAAEDKNKLGLLYGKVRKDYMQCSKRFKRMQRTFFILHDELKVIKQRCNEYAENGA